MDDNCAIDNGSFTMVSQTSNGNSCPEQFTRIYLIEDECGNSATCSQIINVIDDIDPIITCPGNQTAVCDISEVAIYNFSTFQSDGGNISDNCQINESSFALFSEVSDGNTCPEIVVRTYIIEDLCGNTATCTQSITINDDISPELICPPNLNSQCEIAEIPPYTTVAEIVSAGGSVSDNCGVDMTYLVLISEDSDKNTCPETIERVYEIRDLCGNTTTCLQSIVIDDTTPPTVDNLADIDVDCDVNNLEALVYYSEFLSLIHI